MKTPENTFIVIDKETGKAVAEVSNKLSLKVNPKKYICKRPSEYLPDLNWQYAREVFRA